MKELQVKTSIIVPVDLLTQEPYASVLCFPNPSEAELQSRIEELRGLGVEALEFSGVASVFGVKVPVLGKGFVGIVVIALVGGQRAALKILRCDSGRADLLHEAHMLRKANSVGVGPALFGASRNFLVVELVDGDLLPNWLKANPGAEAVKRVLREVLEQCWRLDEEGLDHGELSKAPKHLLVDHGGKVFIVDFETSSVERRVANVTAACQYLFVGSSTTAAFVTEVLGERDKEKLVSALRNYKLKRNREAFNALLAVCFF